MTKLFLCGPMSSLPENNYPAFNAVAAEQRARGHEVFNPAENPARETWAGYMRLSIPQMLQCDSLLMLPGWEKSEGATLERQIARKLGMPVSYLPCVEVAR